MMEKAKLILEYIRTFIWPVTFIGLALLFKHKIANLISRIIKANLPGGISIETIPERLEEAKNLSQEVKKETSDRINKQAPSIPLNEINAKMLKLGLSPSPSGLEFDYYHQLAEQDPNLSLAGLRIETEIMLRNVASGFKVPYNNKESTQQLALKLNIKGAITNDQYRLLLIILDLCNSAVHGERVTKREAKDVLNVAEVLRDQYISWLSWGFNFH